MSTFPRLEVTSPVLDWETEVPVGVSGFGVIMERRIRLLDRRRMIDRLAIE